MTLGPGSQHLGVGMLLIVVLLQLMFFHGVQMLKDKRSYSER
jgi:hypothetical protein